MIFNLNVIAEIPAEWIKLKSEVTKIENGNPIKISVSGLADKYEADFCIVTWRNRRNLGDRISSDGFGDRFNFVNEEMGNFFDTPT